MPHDQIEYMGGVDIDALHRIVYEATEDVRTGITNEFDRLRSQRRRWPSPPAVRSFAPALQHQIPPAMMVSSVISPTLPPPSPTPDLTVSPVVYLSSEKSVLPIAPPAWCALPVAQKTSDPAPDSAGSTRALATFGLPHTVDPHVQTSANSDKQAKSAMKYIESGYQSELRGPGVRPPSPRTA